MQKRLPWTAKDIFKLSPKDWLVYNGLICFHRLTGLWRHPVPTSGEFENMTRMDLVYWLYKAQHPVKRAVKNSGLEDFFKQQAGFRWELPAGFRPQSEIRLAAVGDLMDHPYLPNSADCLYAQVADTIFGADISTANLECVIYQEGSVSFKFVPTATPPLCYKLEHFNAAKGMDERKYSFMATACNHSLDCGEAGVESTIRTLKANGIAFNGMNESREAALSATILERKGIKVGMISHTFGLNAKPPPKDKPWIVNRTLLNRKLHEIDFSLMERQIRYCRENEVDVVVAQIHWGLEHEYYPRPEQVEVARHMAELGIDVLIGHHPHVVQPIEFYRTRRDPNRVVPIYYSLGNLLTPFSHPAFRRSAVAQVQLAKGQASDGTMRTYVKHAGTTEVVQEIDEKEEKLRLAHYFGGKHAAS